MSDTMFDTESFNGLKDASEVKEAVRYFSNNEIKFKRELSEQGSSYDDCQNTVRQIWLNLLKLCNKYKVSNYTIIAKKELYSVK